MADTAPPNYSSSCEGDTPSIEAKVSSEPGSQEKSKSDDTKERLTKDEDKNTSKQNEENSLEEAFNKTAPNFLCCFGPCNSFFCAAPDVKVSGSGKFSYIAIASKAPYLIPVSTINSWKVFQFYNVALSPHGAGYWSYVNSIGNHSWNFIGINDSTKPKKLNRNARKEFERLKEPYERLKGWLSENVVTVEDLKTVRVVFGPRARYLAWKVDGTYIANELPTALDIEIKRPKGAGEKDVVMPKHVTFGMGDAWAATWNMDDGYMVELDEKYATLEKYLKSIPDKRIMNLVLDPLSEQFIFIGTLAKFRPLLASNRLAVTKRMYTNWFRDMAQLMDRDISMTWDTGDSTSFQIIRPGDVKAAALQEKIDEAKKACECKSSGGVVA